MGIYPASCVRKGKPVLIKMSNTNIHTDFTQPDVVLPHLAFLRAQGKDAADFLQRQLTCDVRQIQNGTAQLAAWCNPKGRVIADLLVCCAGNDLFDNEENENDFYLVMHKSQLESVAKRMKMFVLRDRVTLTPMDASAIVGCALPAEASSEAYSLPWDETRGIRIVATTEVASAPTTTAIDASNDDSSILSAWLQADIAAGICWLPQSLGNEFLPQMMGLEERHAISFEKGCYPGQEVVARTHYLGRVKRHLQICRYNNAQAIPEVGALIYNQKGDDIGVLVAISGTNLEGVGLAIMREHDANAPAQTSIGAETVSLIFGEKAT
ncbi:MAG: hypothetical protein MI750_16000 [Xanthomonadales bacterium]|nr:hypothetical protein [Xanthomonadales bacterium]